MENFNTNVRRRQEHGKESLQVERDEKLYKEKIERRKGKERNTRARNTAIDRKSLMQTLLI
jgi:hypothetical protein